MDENNGAIYKCIATLDGVYTWDPFTGGLTGDTRTLYYPTLSAAIADINAETADNTIEKTNAKVEVFRSETGRLLVKLVGDVSESNTITVGKSLDLILNGNVLTLNGVGSGIVFAEGTECTVDGKVPGSSIKAEGIVTDGNYVCMTIDSKTMNFNGGTYDFSVDIYSTNLAIKVSESCELFESAHCTFKLKNSRTEQKANSVTRLLQLRANRSVFEDCTLAVEGDWVEGVKAVNEVCFCNTDISAAGATCGTGLAATGCVVYICGGTFSGTSNGKKAFGIDVQKDGDIIYADSATVCGFNTDAASAKVYFDSCIFDAVGRPAGTLGSGSTTQTNTTLYISNCKKTEGTGAFVVETLGGDGLTDSGHRIKNGYGNEFTRADFSSADGLEWSWVENTGEFYRKKHPDAELNGTDLDMLLRMPLQESYYYGDLASAIADINTETFCNSIEKSDAKVEVLRAANGRLLVKLIGDVLENSLITVAKSIDLVLNGKTLAFDSAEARMVFDAGTDCIIDGQADGSAIKAENIDFDSGVYAFFLVNGKSMKLYGGSYRFLCDVYETAILLKATPTCECLEVQNCDFYVHNNRAQQAANCSTRVVQSQAGITTISNCSIVVEGDRTNSAMLFDSILNNVSIQEVATDTTSGLYAYSSLQINDCHVNNQGESKGYGIFAATDDTQIFANRCEITVDTPNDTSFGVYVKNGQASMADCKITASAHAVCSMETAQKIFIDRCSLDGYVDSIHIGGSPNTTVFVTDTIISSGRYSGVFVDEMQNLNPAATIYVGNSTTHNVKIYLDGCTLNTEKHIEGVALEAPFYADAIIFSSSGQQYGNGLYISNTVVAGEGKIVIETPEEGQTAHALYVGSGTNIVEEMFETTSDVFFTGALYRKKHRDLPISGADLDVLTATTRSGTVHTTIIGTNTNPEAWAADGDYWTQDLIIDGATVSSVWWMQADVGSDKQLNAQYERDLILVAKAKAGEPNLGYIRIWADRPIINDIPVVLKEV